MKNIIRPLLFMLGMSGVVVHGMQDDKDLLTIKFNGTPLTEVQLKNLQVLNPTFFDLESKGDGKDLDLWTVVEKSVLSANHKALIKKHLLSILDIKPIFSKQWSLSDRQKQLIENHYVNPWDAHFTGCKSDIKLKMYKVLIGRESENNIFHYCSARHLDDHFVPDFEESIYNTIDKYNSDVAEFKSNRNTYKSNISVQTRYEQLQVLSLLGCEDEKYQQAVKAFVALDSNIPEEWHKEIIYADDAYINKCANEINPDDSARQQLPTIAETLVNIDAAFRPMRAPEPCRTETTFNALFANDVQKASRKLTGDVPNAKEGLNSKIRVYDHVFDNRAAAAQKRLADAQSLATIHNLIKEHNQSLLDQMKKDNNQTVIDNNAEAVKYDILSAHFKNACTKPQDYPVLAARTATNLLQSMSGSHGDVQKKNRAAHVLKSWSIFYGIVSSISGLIAYLKWPKTDAASEGIVPVLAGTLSCISGYECLKSWYMSNKLAQETATAKQTLASICDTAEVAKKFVISSQSSPYSMLYEKNKAMVPNEQ